MADFSYTAVLFLLNIFDIFADRGADWSLLQFSTQHSCF